MYMHMFSERLQMMGQKGEKGARGGGEKSKQWVNKWMIRTGIYTLEVPFPQMTIECL